MTLEGMANSREGLEEAIATIIWYNDHADDGLLDLAEKLYKYDESGKYYSLTQDEAKYADYKNWGTEKHMIWEILVSLFGEWGTSIRSGWIERKNFKSCADYICDLCANTFVWDYENERKGWSKKYPHIAKYYKEKYGFEEEE